MESTVVISIKIISTKVIGDVEIGIAVAIQVVPRSGEAPTGVVQIEAEALGDGNEPALTRERRSCWTWPNALNGCASSMSGDLTNQAA